MDTYQVAVRNELTGEVRTLEVYSTYGPDAQVSALRELFKIAGWRRAVALTAVKFETLNASVECFSVDHPMNR